LRQQTGTTGFPKAILHSHLSLMISCEVEMKHHKQTRKDNSLCTPPLYHTGAKMHWFGSFPAGSKAVLLRGVKPEWIIKAVSEEKITVSEDEIMQFCSALPRYKSPRKILRRQLGAGADRESLNKYSVNVLIRLPKRQGRQRRPVFHF
jgi:hypothetical protein